MKVHVGIAKQKKQKGVAAGVVAYAEDLGLWHTFLYVVVEGKVAPATGQGFDKQEQAFADVCEILRIMRDDFVQIDEATLDDYILKNTRNRWVVTKP